MNVLVSLANLPVFMFLYNLLKEVNLLTHKYFIFSSLLESANYYYYYYVAHTPYRSEP